jgi:hypothetical protein
VNTTGLIGSGTATLICLKVVGHSGVNLTVKKQVKGFIGIRLRDMPNKGRISGIKEGIKLWKHLTTFFDLFDPSVVRRTANFWITVLSQSFEGSLVVS